MMLLVPIYQTTNYWPNANRLGCIITSIVRSSVHPQFYPQSGSTVNLVYVASMLHESPQRYVIKAKSVQYHTVKKSVQYHTVKKSVQYHTIKKLVQYHTVKKSVQYHTVKKDRKAFEVITST
jgi:hypothetical protein